MLLRKINGYSIIELLGKGSFGKVYLVESQDTKHYALKSIQETKQMIEIAQKQVKIYSTLNHPNIVKLHKYFTYENQTCLAMILEYCPDGDLAKLIKGNKLQNQEYQNIIKQIVEGLVYLHDNSIVHRDIKPENILMMNNVPKIVDFGSSKIIMTTGAKTRQGTQFYMAPEIFDGQKYDEKVDIWSLGILSYELLVGKRIFQILQGWRAPAQRKDFPSEGLFNQIVDKKLRELIQMMLRKNPQERPTSREVLDLLNSENQQKTKVDNKTYQNQDSIQKESKELRQNKTEQKKQEYKKESKLGGIIFRELSDLMRLNFSIKHVKKQMIERLFRFENNVNYKNYMQKISDPKRVIVSSTKNKVDKKITKIYNDNSSEILFQNGVKKQIFQDGYTVIHFKNGDIHQNLKDGTDLYYFSQTKTYQITLPNKINIYRFHNNQVEIHHHGTKYVEVRHSDGTTKIIGSPFR